MTPAETLSTFSTLADTQVKLAESEANVVNKYEQAKVTHQEAIRKYLQNMSLFQNINWDAQAHHNLLRVRTQKLKEVYNLKRARDTMNAKVRDVNLLNNNFMEWSAVRNGWLAFEFLRAQTPAPALSAAYEIKPHDDAYKGSVFVHLTPTGVMQTCEDYKGPKSGALLLNWARQKNYLPLMGQPAWEYVTELITRFSEGCAIKLGSLQMQIDLADKAANEILTRDWDRLKAGPRTTGA